MIPSLPRRALAILIPSAVGAGAAFGGRTKPAPLHLTGAAYVSGVAGVAGGRGRAAVTTTIAVAPVPAVAISPITTAIPAPITTITAVSSSTITASIA